MKKLVALLLFVSVSTFTVSCTNDDDNIQYQDNDTIAEVYDVSNVNFTYDNSVGYYIKRTFSPAIYSSDMVLVYQNTATDNGKKVWTLIPRTVYLSNGNEVDYTFDFTTSDVQIYAGGTFDLTNTEYVRNQTFRILVIPAAQSRTQSTVDYSDYNAVVKHFNIKDGIVKSL